MLSRQSARPGSPSARESRVVAVSESVSADKFVLALTLPIKQETSSLPESEIKLSAPQPSPATIANGAVPCLNLF